MTSGQGTAVVGHKVWRCGGACPRTCVQAWTCVPRCNDPRAVHWTTQCCNPISPQCCEPFRQCSESHPSPPASGGGWECRRQRSCSALRATAAAPRPAHRGMETTWKIAATCLRNRHQRVTTTVERSMHASVTSTRPCEKHFRSVFVAHNMVCKVVYSTLLCQRRRCM